MKYIVDRIEGDFAVCEDENGNMTDIPVNSILGTVRASSVLIKEGETVTVQSTDDMQNRILFDRLFKNGENS